VSSLILDGALIAVGLTCMILESQDLKESEADNYISWMILVWGGSQYLVMVITFLDLSWVFRIQIWKWILMMLNKTRPSDPKVVPDHTRADDASEVSDKGPKAFYEASEISSDDFFNADGKKKECPINPDMD